jgi:transcriptional regulator with XRE-family HTH domain
MAPHPNDVLVGANLRLNRNAARMSQTELAEHLGVTFQQIQKYEKGTNRVGAGRLLIIANLLKVPIAAFYEGAKGANAHTIVPIQLLGRRDAFRLSEAFNKIEDQRLRQSLVALVVNLSQRRGL